MNKELFKHTITTQIPIAWIAGVRLQSWEENKVSTRIKYDFLNQNPFKSIFWAVQGMAAEFSSGLMANAKIAKTGENISMLVLGMQSKFLKKAVGKIIFTCEDGENIDKAIKEAISTKEGVLINVKSIGIDEEGDIVSEFQFTWTFKLREKK
ncbi:protein of unknown function [Chishuiella changwenlii]|uniref:Thioesterase n=1 Tax=Chishuiella changwenlii TaxID=1434701 RepID=A0A1M6X6Q1_9FLAO|nr:DUF4442 domain-containing protein [Chishuiella changwenlii]GGE97993.1 thioesterase [Chishuiella changwenlii]SHL01608.1 protein of unknown function [Chishuiella changwenlii]